MLAARMASSDAILTQAETGHRISTIASSDLRFHAQVVFAPTDLHSSASQDVLESLKTARNAPPSAGFDVARQRLSTRVRETRLVATTERTPRRRGVDVERLNSTSKRACVPDRIARVVKMRAGSQHLDHARPWWTSETGH